MIEALFADRADLNGVFSFSLGQRFGRYLRGIPYEADAGISETPNVVWNCGHYASVIDIEPKMVHPVIDRKI